MWHCCCWSWTRPNDTSHNIGMKSPPSCSPIEYFGKLHFLTASESEWWAMASCRDGWGSDTQTGEYLEVTRAPQLRRKSNWKNPDCSMHCLSSHSWKQAFIVKIPSHSQVFLLLTLQWMTQVQNQTGSQLQMLVRKIPKGNFTTSFDFYSKSLKLTFQIVVGLKCYLSWRMSELFMLPYILWSTYRCSVLCSRRKSSYSVENGLCN